MKFVNNANSMKIVCCCAAGNSRSVSLAYLLKHEQGQDAICLGLDIHSEETKNFLFDWADRIIVTTTNTSNKVPEAYSHKTLTWDVGDDFHFRGFPEPYLEFFREKINGGYDVAS